MITGIQPVGRISIMSNNNLVVFGGGVKTVSSVNSKTGGTSVRVLRAGEFREEYKSKHPGATNKEIKREYAAYYRGAIGANTASLAAAMTTGELGVEGYRVNKDGSKVVVTFVKATKETDGVNREELEAALLGMPEDELKAFMNAINELRAADKAVVVA